MTFRNSLINGPLGFGTAPLGNMYREIPEEEAIETVVAAWDAGTRFFDTAPFYGAGLAEIRLGRVLSGHPRNEYLLSTKVGRVILAETPSEPQAFGEKGTLFQYGRRNKVVYDYSGDGTRRSIEDSLTRIGVDRIDFVWIHDLAEDFHGEDWPSVFDEAHRGAMRTLDRMRDEGTIKGWGLGVNRVEPVERLLGLSDVKPDGTLLAGRYTLLDHRAALKTVMPKAHRNGVDIVVGGPYSSGILAGGKNFEYSVASPEIVAKVAKIKLLADTFGVAIKAAAIQFVLANPATAVVIPGASKPDRIKGDVDALRASVPDDFWIELRQQGLVCADAPLPIDETPASRSTF